MKTLDGKMLAEKILLHIKNEITKTGHHPGLAVILVGNDTASEKYVKIKEKTANAVGINFHKYLLPAKTEEKSILEMIDFLNKDEETAGIIVQLPLPAKFDTDKIITSILPAKDVDGFHPENLKNLERGKPAAISPVSQAVMAALDESEKNLNNKKIIILANSEIFAQPILYLLKEQGLTPSLILAKENNWKKKMKSADVIITAIGQPQIIKKNLVKDGVVIIDIGTSFVDGQTVGDADMKNLKDKASFITPTPGGIGPLTVAFLLKNVMAMNK